jgi:hypothetical protein
MTRTRNLLAVTALFALAAGLLSADHDGHPAHRSAASGLNGPAALAGKQEILSAYGKLPLDFEQNQGQFDPRVKFLARGKGYSLFLTGTDATLRLDANPPSLKSSAVEDGLFRPVSAPSTSEERKSAILRLTLEGSDHVAGVNGLELQPGRSNYFIGNKPEQWHRSVPHYARVKYQSVYPGIDLIYYGSQGQLESDYVVSPGADPNRIALHIDGANKLELDARGNLVLATTGGDLSFHQPVAYQEDAGLRKPVAARYILRGSRSVGIQVASYDARQPLIIDPVVVYSTFLGGLGNESAQAVAIDSTGNAYVTGFTTSNNFPTDPASIQPNWPNPPIANAQVTFVTKLNPTASTLVYSTYLGGAGSGTADQGNGIAVNSSGEAFVAGITGATSSFPTTCGKAYACTTANNAGIAFLTELTADGSSLVYSTFLGGSGSDQALCLALDPAGIAYIAGATTSRDFPLSASAYQSTNKVTGVGATTTFLSKIDTTLNGTPTLVYSTYLGGSSGETGNAIAVDSNGIVYITGQTNSTDFPIPPAPAPAPFQGALKPSLSINAFLAKIDTTQSGSNGLLYSSYLGGSGSSGGGDQGNGIALDGNRNAYVVGTTGSLDFPVFPNPGAFQTTNKDANQLKRTAFVSKFDPTKSGAASLIYSTYLGGSGSLGDKGYSIVVDSLKQAYVSGHTTSNDFPLTAGAPQTILQGENAFLAVLNATGSGLIFSTFWGGNGTENGFGMAIDSANPPNLYMAGSTGSTANTFPASPGAFQTVRNGLSDAFVTKFTPASAANGVTLVPGTLAFGNQPVSTTSGPQTVTLTNGGSSQLTAILISFTGANSTDFAQSATGTTCTTTLVAGANCIISVDFTPKTQAAETAQLLVSTSVGPQTVNLTGTGTGTAGIVSVNPTTLSFGTISIGATSAAQTVTLTNNTATPLAGIAISITGTNAADFAQAASGTTCTATLAVSANCTIAATFKPTLASLESATMNIAFTGPTGSPQQVLLSGTGTNSTPDFSIVASPPTATITAGQTAMFTLTVTSMNGFSSAVTAACTGAPGGSTCALTPSSVTPAPNGTATINGTLKTTALTVPPPLFPVPSGPRLPIGVWGLLSLLLALLAAWAATRRTTRKLAFALGLLTMLSLSGCSGLPQATSGTQKGTFAVTVNATAGALKHPATISITVN